MKVKVLERLVIVMKLVVLKLLWGQYAPWKGYIFLTSWKWEFKLCGVDPFWRLWSLCCTVTSNHVIKSQRGNISLGSLSSKWGGKGVNWYEEIWLMWYPNLEYGVGLWILWIGLGWAPLGWWDWTGWSRVAAGLIGRATECLRRAYRPCLGTVRLHSAYHGLERASLPLGVDLHKDRC